MTQFRVDTGAIVGTAQKFSGIAGEFRGQLSAITSEVNSLSSAWSGGANTQFDELIHKWDHDANILTEDLDILVQKLNAAARAYEETEHATRTSFSG